MRLIRSFPDPIPANRNYIVDDAEKLINTDYDYTGLIGLNDDIIHIDWDTAVSLEDLQNFARRARHWHDRVLVAPVKIYHSPKRTGLTTPVWNVRRFLPGDMAMRYCKEGEDAHLFGFGMVYLPREILQGFGEALRADEPEQRRPDLFHMKRYRRFGDIEFAGWHYSNVEKEAQVMWDVKPVHIHYEMSKAI
jgi:hypothetical protein